MDAREKISVPCGTMIVRESMEKLLIAIKFHIHDCGECRTKAARMLADGLIKSRKVEIR